MAMQPIHSNWGFYCEDRYVKMYALPQGTRFEAEAEDEESVIIVQGRVTCVGQVQGQEGIPKKNAIALGMVDRDWHRRYVSIEDWDFE